MRRLLFAVYVFVPLVVKAQESPSVQTAQRAYDALDFETAISAAEASLSQPLSAADRAQAYEILAFSYGALDSTRLAVEAFRELIFLDPNREPDVNRVSPRITSLYASALGQVLVVRGASVDSSSFIAGRGVVPINYSVSRPSRVITRIVGPDFDAVVDSQLVAGTGGLRWSALDETGAPVPPGRYQILVMAVEAANEFSVPIRIEIRHEPVDTVPHLTSLPGYEKLAEMESPPRDWKPLGISVLYAGLSTGAAYALADPDLGDNWRGGAMVVSLAALTTGFIMSIRKPEPRPVEANIRYNLLLDQQLAQQNIQIAADNERRRRQVRLTVVQVHDDGGRP
jgi:hypothetical protein